MDDSVGLVVGGPGPDGLEHDRDALTIYSPEPAGSSADALALLASWSATTLAPHLDDAVEERRPG